MGRGKDRDSLSPSTGWRERREERERGWGMMEDRAGEGEEMGGEFCPTVISQSRRL